MMQLRTFRQCSKEDKARISLGQQPSAPAAKMPELSGGATFLLHLQRSHGNRYIQGLLGSVVQRKCACGGACDHCQSQSAPQGQDAIPFILQRKGSGQSLAPEVQTFMETRFGENFGDVRVHTDTHAETTAQELNARAYTIGRDIFFDAGQYQPQAQEGRQLLAHELTHVVQQRGGLPLAAPVGGMTQPEDPSERVADRIAGEIMSGGREVRRRERSSATREEQGEGEGISIQRVVNERKVGCRIDGVPSLGLTGAEAVEAIREANEEAILMAQHAENMLFIERTFFGDVPPDPTVATILLEELGLDINNATHRERMRVDEERFNLVRTRVLESDFTGHTCIGAAAVSLAGGAAAGDCCTGGTRACSASGIGHIVLCRPWWTGDASLRPGTLVHEGFHIFFGLGDHVNPKRRDAHCYTAFAERLFGVAPFLSCAGR